MMDPAAAADPYCRIAAPEFRQQDGHAALEIALECREAPAEGFLRYPEEGPLYLGVSVFESRSARGEEASLEAGNATDLPFATLEGAVGPRSLMVSLEGAPSEATHFVVALWTRLMECIYCEAEHGLGPVDQDLFPMPLDTYPRPHCDVASLDEIGYFDWAESGDPSGFQAPQDIQDAFGAADCFRRDARMPGLGLSLKSWPVAPLPPAFGN